MSLPTPRIGTEIYLAAVYERLGEILDRLPTPPEPPAGKADGAVELREPEVPAVNDAEPDADKRPASAKTMRKRTTKPLKEA